MVSPPLSCITIPTTNANIPTGWWLAKLGSAQGWAPSAYLKEEAPPPPPPTVVRPTPPPPPAGKANGVNGSKPKPPAPPAKRPTVAGKKPAPTPPGGRDSAVGLGGNSSGDSGRSTPTPSLAGGLAEALRARQSAMSAKKDDEDDDW